LACGLTYYAHPTACAAAVETLNVYRDDQMFDNAARLGPVLRRELDAVAGRLRARPFRRGLGLPAALEIDAPLDRPSAPPGGGAARPGEAGAFDCWARLGSELAAKKLSLHVDGKRGTAIFAPPLCITEQELVTGVRAFGDAAVA